MVARYRPGAKIANSGSFKKNDKKSVDRRKNNGRPPGSPNKLSAELKEDILTALALSGYNKKGKDGIVGYIKRVLDNDIVLGTRLIERVLPLSIKRYHSKEYIFQLPMEVLKNIPEEKLVILQQVMETMEAMGYKNHATTQLLEHHGDPSDYAKEIGITEVGKEAA
jgi:hypothetical protein